MNPHPAPPFPRRAPRPSRLFRRLLLPLLVLAVPAAALAAAIPAAPLAPGQVSVPWLVVELVVAMAVILTGCELFANGVEHVGEKAELSHAAAGSLLAAVGTALPETMIPILAILFGAGGGHGESIGIGAILGAPFMLSTLAFFLLGLTVTLHRALGGRPRWQMELNARSLAFELRWFLLTLLLVFGVSLAGRWLDAGPARALNLVAGAVVLVIYVFYFRHLLHHEAEEHEEYTDTFYFQKLFRLPRTWGTILSQLALGLAAIIVGAHVFVGTIATLSMAIGVSSLVLSLIIAPIATELPEKYNSITWTLKRQDTLAMGNISGALVFQTTIPVAVGLWFTEWRLGNTELLNLAFAGISALLVFLVLRASRRLPAWTLLVGGILYGAYLGRIFVFGA
ncbi:MAG TPA: sodium:calcium antiporter [Thermodesulfobacteriota bacterium]|nr:sodium:calcium antiporter [Thermodesulfobacteriota bacterium]